MVEGELIRRGWTIILCGFLLAGLLVVLASCAPPLETYTVELVPLPGSDDVSQLENPRQTVGRLVLGLSGQQPMVEEVGENLYSFTIEGNLQPGIVARFQTPVVSLELVGYEERVPDNRPIPEDAEVIATEADICSIMLEHDRLGKPVFYFDFTEEGQAKFEEYTANHIEEYVIFGIDGRVVNWIPIREPVLGKTGVIEGRLTKEQALRYLWGIRMSMEGYRLKIVDINPLE